MASYCPADIEVVHDDEINYPDMWKVLVYPRSDITRFPPAELNVENVPGI